LLESSSRHLLRSTTASYSDGRRGKSELAMVFRAKAPGPCLFFYPVQIIIIRIIQISTFPSTTKFSNTNSHNLPATDILALKA